MKIWILLLCLNFSLFANTTLDKLIGDVQKEESRDAALNAKREKEFLANQAKQKELLEQAKNQLKALESRTQKLTSDFEVNEKELAVLQDKLNIATGTLGEMFGIVKQMSGDLTSQFSTSIISSQFKGRGEFVGKLAARKEIPKIEELRRLWMEILNETNESGKIVSFESEVVTAQGQKEVKKVTRLGAFNLVSGGKYLNYQGETDQVIEFARQPDSKYLSMIKNLEKGGEGIKKVGIDPARGTLLGMLVNSPDLMERFHQGGLVGYLIAILVLIGLIISIERTLFLSKEKRKIDQQLNSKDIDLENSLGKLKKTFEDYKNKDVETLELKLEEAIMKEIPRYERGVGTLKLLAAIGPLMGLLGTVTGMIMTFQTITLFGTGDPKLMAGGISSALITTVQGLICAIPMLLLHNFVSGKSRAIIQILEEQSTGLLSEKVSQ